MKYSRKRANAQIQASALKSKALAVGTIIKLIDMDESSFKQGAKEVPNDTIIGTIEGKGRIKVPVREFFKMVVSGASPHYKSEDGTDDIKLPDAIKIVEAVGREDKDKNPIYPVFAYALHDEFLREENPIDWKTLVAGGFVAGHTERFDQVQNYTIELL